MTALLPLLLFMAAAPPATLDQVRAEPNLEKRARLAIDFAVAAEREAESAYAADDLDKTGVAVRATLAAVELARQSFEDSPLRPGRNAGPYKYAELRSRAILERLKDLDRRMDSEDRALLDKPRARIQEIHDAWIEGIMEKRKK